MQIVFESPDPRATRLRDFAEQRLRFVLRRAAFLVPRVKIRLSDLNGPRGGVDKQCRIELMPERGTPIVVTSAGEDWRLAFENALTRGSRALVRSWQRRRRVGRTSVGRRDAAVEPEAIAS